MHTAGYLLDSFSGWSSKLDCQDRAVLAYKIHCHWSPLWRGDPFDNWIDSSSLGRKPKYSSNLSKLSSKWSRKSTTHFSFTICIARVMSSPVSCPVLFPLNVRTIQFDSIKVESAYSSTSRLASFVSTGQRCRSIRAHMYRYDSRALTSRRSLWKNDLCTCTLLCCC